MTTGFSMQAALYIREKQKQRQKKTRRGRFELPSHVATREIGPFPVFPPQTWPLIDNPEVTAAVAYYNRRFGKAAAAWGERDRRSSEVALSHRPLRHPGEHRRWISRNRIQDSSYGGSSSEEEEGPGGLHGQQSAAANALLYVGLGTVAIGLVIAFVGTGEKGFKTLELRLIGNYLGPSLIAGGLLCCLLRIFLCVCPCRRKKKRSARHLDKNDYYRHLPFNARTAEDFMLVENTSGKKKKRVSILPAVASTSDPPPRILLPDNLIELKEMDSDLPSISSEDSFNIDRSLALLETERMARLKSTLTFGDSLEGDLSPRESEPLNSPLLFQQPDEPKELVLSPSNLEKE